MGNLFDLDWAGMFAPNTPFLEIFIRGSVMYLGIFLLLRVVIKRQTGSVGISDLLVVVLADAAQNGMAADYRSIVDGLLLVATILFWSYFLDWLGYRFAWLERLIHPSPLLLVEHGRMLRGNMRKEFITKAELETMLREQGVEDIAQAEKVFMEGDGQISVITRDRSRENQKPKRVP